MSRTRVEVIAGRYELTGEVIASGGMGRVVAGHDRALDRPVAIKLLSFSVGDAPGARKRFRSEAVSAARLSHPNVVAILDAGEHDGRAFIVMERLPGLTLADELARGPMPADRSVSMIRQVLKALHAAHEAGIIHRDVKPGNVLIAEDGSAKLSDFGIAKLLERDATMTRELMGTPAYVAPELLEGRAASPQSDIYSAGIMLFEALAGRKPFAGEPSVAHLAAAQDGRLPSILDVAPWVDARLAGVVDQATRRTPDERFQSAAEMSEALSVAMASAPDATVPMPEPLPQATRVLDRARALQPGSHTRVKKWAALVVAAVLAVTAIVLLIVSQQSSVPGETSPRTTQAPAGQPRVQQPQLPAPLESALLRLEQAVNP